MSKALSWFTNLYAVWVIGMSIVAFMVPGSISWFDGPWVRWALSLVMLGMGLTLHVTDFKGVVEKPLVVAVGVSAQYIIMPLTAWGIAKLLGLRPEFAVGLILVGCCPGGTASNVVAFLARANVALSVVLTMVSTLLAAVMTPLLTELLAGQYIPIDVWGIFKSTIQVVLVPVLLGIYINYKFPRISSKANKIGPAVAVMAIVMIAGSIVARNVDTIRGEWKVLALAGLLLHSVGFLLGYWVIRALRMSRQLARTVSIEVGMQNSGLAMVLAQQHFSAATASPAVFSSVFHTLVGSLCAAYWRLNPVKDPSAPPEKGAA
ncbi:MAG: bile acid:sodium symporter family protein [Kiritimatiellales bacterium]|nr:bile acid:sodium symporter family protein [Kiritimatiellales bacterium]